MFQDLISTITSNNPVHLRNLIEGANIWPVVLATTVGIVLFFCVFALSKKLIPDVGQDAKV